MKHLYQDANFHYNQAIKLTLENTGGFPEPGNFGRIVADQVGSRIGWDDGTEFHEIMTTAFFENATAIPDAQIFTGAAIVNPLTLSEALDTGDAILVFIDGNKQNSNDYSIVGDQLTFNSDPHATVQTIEVQILPSQTTGEDGAPGASVELEKTATHLRWRLIGAPSWTNIVALSEITGPQGSNVEFQISATHIQHRQVGDFSWTDLVALSTLTGAKGDQGDKGDKGDQGDPGTDEANVAITGGVIDGTDIGTDANRGFGYFSEIRVYGDLPVMRWYDTTDASYTLTSMYQSGATFLIHADQNAKYPDANIRQYIGGVEHQRLTSDGFLGIGEIAPEGRLHLKHDTAADGQIAMAILETDGATSLQLRDTTGTTFSILSDSDQFRLTSPGGQSEVVVWPDGQAAIETALMVGASGTKPDEILHLKSAGKAVIKIEADTDNAIEQDIAGIEMLQDGGAITGFLGFTENNDMEIIHNQGYSIRVKTSDTSRMSINAAGNVSFGPYDPTYLFEVKNIGNVIAYLQSADDEAVQLRLKTNNENRRIVAVDSSDVVQSQVIMRSNVMRLTGPTESEDDTWLQVGPDSAKVAAPEIVGRYGAAWYGLPRDGVSNCSVALGEAFDYAMDHNGPVEMPAGGRFVLSSAVIRNRTGAAVKTGLIGKGQGATNFFIPSTNTTGGILIDVQGTADKSDQFIGRDFSIETDAIGGVGLRFKQSPGGVQDLNSVIAENIRIFTDQTGTKYLSQAFDFDGAWRPIIRNCFWGGPVYQYTHQPTDPCYGCDIGLNLNNCYDPIIDTVWIKGAKVGISSVDTRHASDPTANESEAFRMTMCVLNQVETGFRMVRTTREPLVMIDKTHSNYKHAAFSFDGVKVGQIFNNNFFNEDHLEVFSGIPTDIRLINASEIIIAQNTFHYNGHTSRVGVFIDSDGESIAGHNNMITNNLFNAPMQNAIRIETGADNNTGSGNMYVGTIALNVSDSGSGNTVT